MTKPYKTSIEISCFSAAIANMGTTWPECWEGILEGKRNFVPGDQIVPGWPQTPPVAAIRDFEELGNPAFSQRFEWLLRHVGRRLKPAVDTLYAKNPELDVSILLASSGGDAGPLSALVDRQFSKSGLSEPITAQILDSVLGKSTAGPLNAELQRSLPSAYIFGACGSSLVAASYACDRINAGLSDIVLLVALDTMSRFASVGFANVGANAPAGTTPYDVNRAGTTVAEGAVGIILARQGVLPAEEVVGRIAGAAVYCDAAHLVEPSATGVERVIKDALAQSGCTPKEISAVYWHGTGTIQNDKAEAAVASSIWTDDPQPPGTSTKGTLGHTLGASGGFNILAACETFKTGKLPPVAGTTVPEFEGLNIVLKEPKTVETGPILITALGFGGINAAIVMKSPHPHD